MSDTETKLQRHVDLLGRLQRCHEQLLEKYVYEERCAERGSWIISVQNMMIRLDVYLVEQIEREEEAVELLKKRLQHRPLISHDPT